MAYKRKRSSSNYVRKRRKFARGGRRKNFVKAVKQIAMRSLETKDYLYWPLTTTNFVQGVPVSWNIFFNIGQGVSDSSRIGDEIFANRLHARFVYYSASVSTTTNVQVMLVKSPVQTNTTSLTYNQIFINKIADPTVDFIDDEQVTVLKRRSYTVQPTISGISVMKNITFTKNFKNMKFKYNGDNSGYGKFANYYLVVVVQNGAGTWNVTAAGTGRMEFKMLYKDG